MEQIEDVKEPKYTMAFFYDIDMENKLCIDCNSPFPSFFSINNGVILCEKCANAHKSNYNYNISFIRSINDEWDEYLISFIQRGGNNRFICFCNDYNITSLPIEKRYNCKIVDYYRRMLRSEVLSEEPPELIYLQYALEPNETNNIIFPEFEDYKLYKGSLVIEKNDLIHNVKENVNYIIKQVKNQKVGEKVLNGSSAIWNKAKTIGFFLKEKFTPVVSYVSNKASDSVIYVKDKIISNS